MIWVPKQLIDVQKLQQMAPLLMFLECYNDKGGAFFVAIIMGDGTWIQFKNVEPKEQSMHSS